MQVIQTDVYETWLRKLKRKDPRTAARIQMRVDRLVTGNPGDAAPVGGGLSELRIHHGPGFRVYYWQMGKVLLILLCGGDKSTQSYGHREGSRDREGVGETWLRLSSRPTTRRTI